MSRAIQFIIFIFVFTSIYFLMNYYVIRRFFYFFSISSSMLLWLSVFIGTLSFIVSNALVRIYFCSFTRILNGISSVWMGMLVFFLTLLALYEIIKLFVPLNPLYTGIVILSAVLIISVVSIINASVLNVKEVTVEIPDIDSAHKYVLLSDIHIGSVRNTGFLKKVVEKTNSQYPEAVFITGDLVDGSAPLRQHMFDELKELKAPAYFVTGNHEMYEGEEKVMAMLNDAGLILLDNDLADLGDMQLVGVKYSTADRWLESTLLKFNLTKPSILLYHTPSELDAAKKAGIDLMLSGHTHNGQIWPFNLLVKLEYRKIKGLYDVDDMNLYVSPGTGTWGPPMRLGSRNEITLINIVPKGLE